VDDDEESQYLLITLKTEDTVLRYQFEEVLNFFSNLVEKDHQETQKEIIIIKNSLIGLPSIILRSNSPDDFVQIEASSTTSNSIWDEIPESKGLPPSETAKTIADGLINGAEYVALGFNHGTQFAETLIRQLGSNLIQTEGSYTRKTIDPRVIRTFRAIRIGAETTSTAAINAVESVVSHAQSLTHTMIPHIQKYGTTLISFLTGKEHNVSAGLVNDALVISSSGVKGFVMIYSAIKNNTQQVSKSMTEETIKYLEKTYGYQIPSTNDEDKVINGKTSKTKIDVQSICTRRRRPKKGLFDFLVERLLVLFNDGK
jgi:hypothetical protein